MNSAEAISSWPRGDARISRQPASEVWGRHLKRRSLRDPARELTISSEHRQWTTQRKVQSIG